MQPDIEALKVLGSKLAGEPVRSLQPSGEGANSRILRLVTPTRTLALKCYPVRPGDTRDRLEVEWEALSFLRRQGLDVVPEPLAVDRDRRVMLMEWLEGPVVTRHTAADLEAAIGFIESIYEASRFASDEGFPLASEACLSAEAIVCQIEERLEMLADDAAPASFVRAEIVPAFDRARHDVERELAAPAELPEDLRRLIPADFGFHNAIRTASGRLRFFDLDYFGWDDPVKLTADFLLHPAMSLAPAEKRLFRSRMIEALQPDRDFADRLRRHLRLYGVRWALILLNPFRRDRASVLPASPADLDRLAADRTAKARRVMAEAERLMAA